MVIAACPKTVKTLNECETGTLQKVILIIFSQLYTLCFKLEITKLPGFILRHILIARSTYGFYCIYISKQY